MVMFMHFWYEGHKCTLQLREGIKVLLTHFLMHGSCHTKRIPGITAYSAKANKLQAAAEVHHGTFAAAPAAAAAAVHFTNKAC